MKPKTRAKLPELKRKLKMCATILAIVVLVGMVVAIVALSLMFHFQIGSNDSSSCSNNKDSPVSSNLVGERANGSKCENAKLCGQNAKCTVFRDFDHHQVFACSCLQGFEGTPPYCRKFGDKQACTRNFDCPSEETCNGTFCFDPCDGMVVCGKDAKCEVINHLPVCRCTFFRTGDPFKSCDKQGWTTLLVTSGQTDDDQSTAETEIIDLLTGRSCTSHSLDFPMSVYGSVSSVIYPESENDDERVLPIVCGGSLDNGLSTSACYVLNSVSQSWESDSNMTEPRLNAAMTMITDSRSSIPNSYMVTGGRSNRRLFSTDQLLTTGSDPRKWSKSILLPRAVQSHCIVPLNARKLIMIGGRTHTGPIKETHLFDLIDQKWSSGPEMRSERSGHSCITRQIGENKTEIWVIGGNDGEHVLNSVEILKSYIMEWTPGPYLPYEVENSASVYLDTHDSIYVVGGKTIGGKNTAAILKLSQDNWEVLKTSLRMPRSSHVAILLPHYFNKC